MSEARLDTFIGNSPAILATKRLIARAAANATSHLLFTGEPGTGKRHAARLIHHESNRGNGPFVRVHVSAQPKEFVEAELFGQEDGASPTADPRRGALEAAHGGTLLLDDVGSLPIALQQKLLRFLATGSFTRASGVSEIEANVRVIGATDRALDDAVKEGAFDPSLFERLQGLSIHFPPLRKRTGDVALLASHFIDRCNGEYGRRVRGLTPEAVAVLAQHRWPRNVAELRNVIERMMLFAEGEWIGVDDLPDLDRVPARAAVRLPPHGVNLDDLERQLVVQALERSAGNQTKAGQLLGLNRDQVRYRIEKFSLPHPHGRVPEAIQS
jgi:two-component system NtrC family response regulator